ncbi:MAG: hypothetical protein Q7S92_04525 [Candidatus Diapherotrites archaeon]|nr:hypothetical protein [Candidatus Diapherotrites archaeon]
MQAIETIQANKKVIAIVLMEFALLVSFIYSLIQIIQINVFERTVSFNFSPEYLFLAGLSLFTFIAVYFVLKKKQTQAYDIQVLAGKTLKDAVQQKLKNAKNDPRVLALIIIEIVFAFFIAYAIAAYLDPELTFINWENYGIVQPYSYALNVGIFIVILAVFLKLYQYTASFRSEK